MAFASGTSSGSSQLANSGSEEDIQALINERKQKRMLSNRESARRSRMRKQKHLDDLAAQLGQLRKQNSQIVTAITITSQHYCAVETDNSVLRTQIIELSNRLQSLNEILFCINGDNGFVSEDFEMRPWNYMGVNQTLVASADMFPYC